MKEKQKELINYLLRKDQPIPARKIAEKLDISLRTVKNYVREINHSSDEKIIFSSNLGYAVSKEGALALISKAEVASTLPQNFKERAFYIIKKKLLDNAKLNIFDLSEEIFVSYSTLKADIFKMNKTFSNYDLKFVIKNDLIRIIGDEKEKRRLISYIIFEEMPYQFMDTAVLEQSFDVELVNQLKDIIRSAFSEQNYYLNDFSFMNLLLHLLILVESVRNGKSLISKSASIAAVTADEITTINQLSRQLEKNCGIELNELEKEEIGILVHSNANYMPKNSIEDLQNVVGENVVEAVSLVIAGIFKTYGVNLNHQGFVVSFSLHLTGLIARVKQNTFLKNPMIASLKKDFPLVYDISVFASLKLSELFGIAIDENECAYIALHIGAELEGQKRNRSKIKTVLLCPKYMNLDVKLYNQILSDFGNELNIRSVISQLSEAEDIRFDLLISTLQVPENERYDTIVISPLYSEEQRTFLYSEILNIRISQKKRILSRNFDNYFDEKYFYSDFSFTDKSQLIRQMCTDMEEEEIVTPAFFKHVLERENASSTAFESIAIPHSVYMDANKTTIAAAISDDGLPWGDRKVNVVLLAAINDLDKGSFSEIYEALISLFDYPEIYGEIKQIKTFKEFKDFILSKCQ